MELPDGGSEVSTAIKHGSHGAYTNRKCRCGRCREANRLYHASRTARDFGSGAVDEMDPSPTGSADRGGPPTDVPRKAGHHLT